MTTFILPTSDRARGPRKRGTYCTILADIVRAADDATDALTIFGSLLQGNSLHGFSHFDAHVGETGCHLRATMLVEIFVVCRNYVSKPQSSNTLPDWIVTTTRRLSTIRENAEQLCTDLTKHRKDPRTFGLGLKRDAPDHIVHILSGMSRGFVRYC